MYVCMLIHKQTFDLKGGRTNFIHTEQSDKQTVTKSANAREALKRKYCIFLNRSPGVYFVQDFLNPGI